MQWLECRILFKFCSVEIPENVAIGSSVLTMAVANANSRKTVQCIFSASGSDPAFTVAYSITSNGCLITTVLQLDYETKNRYQLVIVVSYTNDDVGSKFNWFNNLFSNFFSRSYNTA